MKTNYEKLKDKLCEVEAIKDDIEKLKIGTKLLDKEPYHIIKIFIDEPEACFGVQVMKSYYDDDIVMPKNYIGEGWEEKFFNDFVVIGNKLDYHHLMMWNEKHSLREKLSIDLWNYKINGIGEDYKSIKIAKLNPNKPFSEQSDEVYKKILDFLNIIEKC